MDYFIETSAIEDFKRIFVESIESSIRKMINNRFLLKENQYEISISFFEEDIVFIKIKNDSVIELNRVSYEHFIPDGFLENLSAVYNLPQRLNRYKKMGLDRFRSEIKESLQDGKIIVQNNTVHWPDYNFNLKVNRNISLESILS